MWDENRNKYLTATHVIELLSQVPPETLVFPVPTKNLVLLTPDFKSFGMIDFLLEGELTIWRNTMNFGKALEHLKDGGKVQREGWNGKGMFLFLVPGSQFQVNRAPLLGIYPEGTTINYQSHIDMKTAQDTVVPWLASQSDMLAEDWITVP